MLPLFYMKASDWSNGPDPPAESIEGVFLLNGIAQLASTSSNCVHNKTDKVGLPMNDLSILSAVYAGHHLVILTRTKPSSLASLKAHGFARQGKCPDAVTIKQRRAVEWVGFTGPVPETASLSISQHYLNVPVPLVCVTWLFC